MKIKTSEKHLPLKKRKITLCNYVNSEAGSVIQSSISNGTHEGKNCTPETIHGADLRLHAREEETETPNTNREPRDSVIQFGSSTSKCGIYSSVGRDSKNKVQWHCRICKVDIHVSFNRHENTNLHKINARRCIEENCYAIESNFNGKIEKYHILPPASPKEASFLLPIFFADQKTRETVTRILTEKSRELGSIKFSLSLFINFKQSLEDQIIDEMKHFHPNTMSIFNLISSDENPTSFLDPIFEKIGEEIDNFNQKGSNWIIDKISHIELHIFKYNPFRDAGGEQELSFRDDLRAGDESSVDLKSFFGASNSIFSPKKNDDLCFKSCIQAFFIQKYLAKKFMCENKRNGHPDILTSRQKQSINRKMHLNYKSHNRLEREIRDIDQKNRLNWDGVSFPVSKNDIVRFAAQNQNILSLSITSLDVSKSELCYQVYYDSNTEIISRKNLENHINLVLLYNSNDNTGHFVLVKSMDRFMRSKFSKSKRTGTRICTLCRKICSSDNAFLRHNRIHNSAEIPLEMPSKEQSIYKFTNYLYSTLLPFNIFADAECLISHFNKQKAQSILTGKHIAVSFAYYVHCSFNESLNEYVSFEGINCVSDFIKSVLNKSRFLWNMYIEGKNYPIDLSRKERDSLLRSYKDKKCIACNKGFDEYTKALIDIRENRLSPDQLEKAEKIKFTLKPVLDHCHYLEKNNFRAILHSKCNFQIKDSKYGHVNVFFHNLEKYDSHLFVKELLKFENQNGHNVSVIPHTSENYLTMTKSIQLTNLVGGKQLKVQFKDSLKFLPASLENLAKNLEGDDFKYLKKVFPNISDEDLELLKGKQIYPYEAMTSLEDYEKTELPSIEQFKSSLNEFKPISASDYDHAKLVWEKFNCKTMWDYTKLYQKVDVMILVACYLKFREEALSTFNLDPSWYISLPQFSYDCAFKYTNAEVELLQDEDMFKFIQASIRGGLSFAGMRHAKAHNKYMYPEGECPEIENEGYLMYFDFNALYSYCLTQKLPLKDFSWVDIPKYGTAAYEEFVQKLLSHDTESDTNFLVQCDFDYPTELHDHHSDFPFLIERRKLGKVEKLVASVHNKQDYIANLKIVQQAVKHGLVLKSVKKCISYTQGYLFRPYIELNARKRKEATNAYARNCYKYLTNILYGKCLERPLSRVDFRFSTVWERNLNNNSLERFIADPLCKRVTHFGDGIYGVEFYKESHLCKKPFAIGTCILDYAKHWMYKWYYDFFYPLLDYNCTILYHDTDSCVVYSNLDIYDKIRPFINNQNEDPNSPTKIYEFDTSEYPEDNRQKFKRVNKKKIGCMKDEMSGQIITEGIFLRAKSYCLSVHKSTNTVNRAKGVKTVISRGFSMEDYRDCLENPEYNKMCSQSFITSNKHEIFTQRSIKIGLNGFDDKRFQLNDGSHKTLPLGHYRIPEIERERSEIEQLEQSFIMNA